MEAWRKAWCLAFLPPKKGSSESLLPSRSLLGLAITRLPNVHGSRVQKRFEVNGVSSLFQ